MTPAILAIAISAALVIGLLLLVQRIPIRESYLGTSVGE
ncbi:MAG: hypothetical protein JWP25_3603 [Bradyrhizobium sp.]|nr:hypothetical protein [Bradyrhizobium sp.]